jgi:hypothetical protein
MRSTPTIGWVIRRVLGVLAAVVFLAGCAQRQAVGPADGASSAGAVEPDASGSADPDPALSPTISADPGPAPSPTIWVPPGRSVTLATGVVLTVYTYDKWVATDAPAPEPGGYWSAADVGVCAGSGADAPAGQEGITVTRAPWGVLLGNGSVARPSDADYRQFPQPQFPRSARTLAWGHCARGWIMFADAAQGHGATGWTPAVQYQLGPEGPGNGQTVYWVIGDP